jgi:sugar lactone lactonase YvrE
LAATNSVVQSPIGKFSFPEEAILSARRVARAADNRLYEISPDDDIRVLAENEPMIPTVSPDGRFWALSDAFYPNSPSGVWIGEYCRALKQIFADKISTNQILFSPDGNTLYFLDAGGNLYRAQAPDWKPVKLASDLQPMDSNLALAWLGK